MDKHAIIVVISSFVLHCVCFGIIQSFGVIFTELLDYFQSTKSDTSWTSSISNGLMYLLGPIAGILEKRYGVKVVIGAGSLLVTTGLALSSFVTRVQHLYLTYGVFLGFGLCFLNVGATVPVNLYFTKYRVLAYAVASTGVGIGTLSFPLLIRYLLRNYGWRGTFLLFGGVSLQGMIAGLVLPSDKLKHEITNVKCSKEERTDRNTVLQKRVDDTEEQKDLIENKTEVKHAFNDIDSETSDTSIGFRRPLNRCLSSKTWVAVLKFTNEARELHHNTRYVLYTLGIVLATMVYFIPYIMIPDLARKRGVSNDSAAFLITISGISGLFGRILTGFAYKLGSKGNVLLNAGLLFTSGCLVFVCSMIHSYDFFIVYSVIWGCLFNAWGTICTTALYDMTGRRLYVTGLSVLLLFCAIVGSVGPPIGGFIADVTGSYIGTFYYAGGMFIVGSIFILLTIFFLHKAQGTGKTIDD